MKFFLRVITSPVIVVIVILIAVFEFLLLYRHNVIKDVLIARGFIEQDPIERADYHCLIGWENTLKKLNYKADICFVGNSLTFHSNFQEVFTDKRVVNLGYSGDRIDGLTLRHKQISYVEPDKIFIMIGVNDLVRRRLKMLDFRTSYNRMLDSIISTNPISTIYIQSILPVNETKYSHSYTNDKIREANQVIKEIADERSIVYIDLFSLYAIEDNELPADFTVDGIHLKTESYKIWSDAIEKYIEE